MGVPGDEDGGGMTAFVVFSQLGFYCRAAKNYKSENPVPKNWEQGFSLDTTSKEIVNDEILKSYRTKVIGRVLLLQHRR